MQKSEQLEVMTMESVRKRDRDEKELPALHTCVNLKKQDCINCVIHFKQVRLVQNVDTKKRIKLNDDIY